MECIDNCNLTGVTVGIPFYKGTEASHLKLAVDSMLEQTLKPDCIHLIRDGLVSREIEELVNSYLATHKDIKYLVISQNKGLPYALNYSILNTSTRYYARMDSDDIAHPGRLQKQVEFLENNPEIDILGTDALEFMHDPHNEACFHKKMPVDSAGVEAFFHYRNPLVHSSVIFRRSVFSRIGLYDVYYRTDQDLHLWGRAIRMKVGITNLREPLLYFRIGSIDRRSKRDSVIRQIRARYSYNTWSLRLNLLKAAAILFRLMPASIRNWGYKRLR